MVQQVSTSRLLSLCALVAVVALIGCSGPKSTIQPVWQTDVGPDATVDVSPEADAVVVREEKNLKLLGGADGRLRMEQQDPAKESFGGFLKQAMKESVSLGGVSVADFDAQQYDFVILEELSGAVPGGVMLVFDYSLEDDVVRAYSVASGRPLWESEGYAWSLEKYSAGTRLASVAGLGGRAAAGEVSQEVLRNRYTESLILPIPEQDAFLFKTLGGLRLLDAKTGEQRWVSSRDVTGTGMLLAAPAPEGDLLVVTTYTSLLEAMQGGKEILRIDPETGVVKWNTRYSGSGDRLASLETVGDLAVLTFEGGGAEVFSIETGQEHLQTWTDVADDLELYIQYSQAQPVLDGTSLYAVEKDFNAVGPPDQIIRKFDLTTGEVLWSSPPIEKVTDIGDLAIVANGDFLVARSAGGRGVVGQRARGVYGYDAQTGEQRWSRVLNDGRQTTPLIVGDGVVYTAGGDSLWALDVQTGRTVRGQAFGEDVIGVDLDRIEALEDYGDRLLVLGRKGAVFVDKADFSLAGAMGYTGRSLEVMPFDRYLIVPFATGLGSDLDGLDLVSLDGADGPSLIGTVRNAQRYQPTVDGSALYIVTKKDVLRKYALN